MATKMRLDKDGLARIRHTISGVGEGVATAVYRDARRHCPRDTGELKASIKLFNAGRTWYVSVGTDHWRHVEYGTRPHVIRSHGSWPLRSADGEVFGPVVHHPGTAASPFMRPAIYRTRAFR